jgi:4'-phosphopantetheinyl transferase
MLPTFERWRGASLGVALVCLPLPDAFSADDFALLSDDERLRANTFGSPRRRVEYVASRAHLRGTLAGVMNQAPDRIDIAADEFGKPQIAAGGVHFNLSHTAGAVLIGWGAGPLGVDLEKAARSTRYIQRLPLLREISAASGVGSVAAFTLVEAALKAFGRGLRAAKGLRLERVDSAGTYFFAMESGAIEAVLLRLPPDYVGAVAVVV